MSKTNGKAKFYIFTALGLFVFIVRPPHSNDNILLMIIHAVQDIFQSYYSLITLSFMLSVCLLTIYVKLLKPKQLARYQFIRKNFNVKALQIIFRFAALFFVVSYKFLDFSSLLKLNASSAEIIEMTGSIIIFITIANFFLPLLSEYGLAEFLEVMLDKVIKPVFRVPGNAMVNLVTSFFVGSTMSMYLTGIQYEKGIYSKQEAMRIMTTLTVPSLSTGLLYWSVIGDSAHFFKFFGLTVLVFFTMAFIMVRIPPFINMDSDKSVLPTAPQSGNKLQHAIHRAGERAFNTRYSVKNSLLSVSNILLSFVPFLITLGTLSVLLIEYTNVFEILSYPYGFYLKIFNIEQPFLLSQTLILYTIDLIMPAVILRNIISSNTQIIMAAITMNQLIYIAPMLIIMSFHGLTTKKELFIIFLQRIILSVPITLFWSWFIL
jgi:nucleoside recognition membrane protein YjiH